MLYEFVLDFTYVVPLRNEGESKANGVENRGQILDFSAGEKLGERWVKCLSEFFCERPRRSFGGKVYG